MAKNDLIRRESQARAPELLSSKSEHLVNTELGEKGSCLPHRELWEVSVNCMQMRLRMGLRGLTVQNLVVSGVGDKAAAVLGPIQVGDKTGMALGRTEGAELEQARAEPRRRGQY